VVFIKKDVDQKTECIGAGVIVVRDGNSPSDLYVVTAKHVVEDAAKKTRNGRILIQFNKKSGGTHLIETKWNDWKSAEVQIESVDIAIVRFNPPEDAKISSINVDEIFAKAEVSEGAVGIGDQVFITGLLPNRAGKKNNIPILKMGNIAAMPDEPIPIAAEGDAEAELYLLDAISLKGMSGSPVFAISEMRMRPTSDKKITTTMESDIRLLGIVSASLGPTGTMSTEDALNSTPSYSAKVVEKTTVELKDDVVVDFSTEKD